MDKFYPYMMYGFPPPPRTFATYYDYLVVVDFEATCDDTKNNNNEPQRPLRNEERPEIIQFPAVLVNVREMVIVDSFDSYVRPVERPILSDFCTSLTGITQSMVDDASTFPKVLRKFERWLKKHGLSLNGNGRPFAIVADGSYDMGHFLYKQCLISNIPYPSYARRWVNIRTIYSKFYGHRWFSLKSVLEMMNQPFEGRQHNGLDDAKNIAKVLLVFIREGCIITHTEKIVLDQEDQEENEIRILNDKTAGKWDLATVKSVNGNECLCFDPPNIFCRPPETEDPIPSKQDNKENLPTNKERKNKDKRHLHRGGKNKKTANKWSKSPESEDHVVPVEPCLA